MDTKAHIRINYLTRRVVPTVLLVLFLGTMACGSTSQVSPLPVTSTQPGEEAGGATHAPPRPSSTPKPTSIPPLSTQDLVSTVVASGPKIEVSFDGALCSMEAPADLPAGFLYTRFTNTTGHNATPWLGRCYPEKGWQDLLDWVGPPGTIFHKETPSWFALQTPDRNVYESPAVSYRRYELKILAEYIIFIEYPSDYWWPCGSFLVKTSS